MSIFNSFSKQHNDQVAVIDDENNQFKYSDLTYFKNDFKSKIPPRSLVFCLCKNNIESLMGYYSFLENKIVPLLLDVEIHQDLLDSLVDIYKPNYIWTLKSKVLESQKSNIIYNYNNYSLVFLKSNPPIKMFDSLALLLTTSGSTGSPKLVRLSYQNLLSNAISISKYLLLDKNERPITTLPLNYSFGMSIINSHLINGSTILLTNKSVFSAEFWKFLKSKKPTSISGVPFTFEMLNKLRFFSMDLPFITSITQAGGKMNLNLTKQLAEYCKKTNKHLYVMYGQTEASPRISYLPPNKSLKKIGSIGIPIPDGNLSLVDSNSQIIYENEVEGELVYKGPNVCLGYASKISDLGKEDENNGILYTGDIAYRDSDNYFYITGRKKRFIKLFGNRINLDDVERLVNDQICENVCVGNDSFLLVYVVEEKKMNEVKDLIIDKFKLNGKFIKTKLINEIPKNSYGKTIYSTLNIDNMFLTKN
jgi:long-chain acyl-CoA synthetase